MSVALDVKGFLGCLIEKKQAEVLYTNSINLNSNLSDCCNTIFTLKTKNDLIEFDFLDFV